MTLLFLLFLTIPLTSVLLLWSQPFKITPLNDSLGECWYVSTCTGAKLCPYTKMWFSKPLKGIILKIVYFDSIFLRITNSFPIESSLGILNLLMVKVRSDFPILMRIILLCLTTVRCIFVDVMERRKTRFFSFLNFFIEKSGLPPCFSHFSYLPHLPTYRWSLWPAAWI